MLKQKLLYTLANWQLQQSVLVHTLIRNNRNDNGKLSCAMQILCRLSADKLDRSLLTSKPFVKNMRSDWYSRVRVDDAAHFKADIRIIKFCAGNPSVKKFSPFFFRR